MASTRGKADSMVDNPLHSVKHARLDSRTPSEFFDSMRGLDVESSAPPAKSVCSSKQARLALAILGIAGLCAAVAIALFVTSSSQGQSISVPDAFTAKFTATSRAGPDREWRGQMHKTTGANGKWHVQALLTNTVNDTQARITVVNDRAYYATYNATTMKLLTSQCYSAYMPPLGDLTQVFGNAVFSPASDPPALVTTPECSSRDRFTLQWGPTNVLRSNTFVFCAVADSTFQIGGHNFIAHVYDYDPSPASSDTLHLPVPPNVTSGEPLQCSDLPPDLTAFGNTASQRRLRVSQQPSQERELLTAANLGTKFEIPVFIPGKTGPPRWPIPPKASHLFTKDCIMVPGLGSSRPSGSPTTSEDTAYWGDLHEILQTEQCAKVQFLHLDYQSKGWDNIAHVDAFCAVASDGVSVRNKIIISHGVGGVVVAKAFATGACQKSSGTFWFRLSNQLGPSLVADAAGSLCSPSSQFYALEDAVVDAGICQQASPHGPTAGSQSMKSSTGSLPGPSSYTTAAGLADAAMCGTTAIGLQMIESAQLYDVQAMTSLTHYQNDGIGATQYCVAGSDANAFEASASYLFYALQANFLDATCRNGDPFLDPMQWASPCLWIATGVHAIVNSGSLS